MTDGLEKYAVLTGFFFIHFTILVLKDIGRSAESFVVFGFVSDIRVPLCNAMICNDMFLGFLKCSCLVS